MEMTRQTILDSDIRLVANLQHHKPAGLFNAIIDLALHLEN
jgi:hypothetical protein